MCVHCEERASMVETERVPKYLFGLADCLGTPHGLYIIGAGSRT
jgi:hypothetical protein